MSNNKTDGDAVIQAFGIVIGIPLLLYFLYWASIPLAKWAYPLLTHTYDTVAAFVSDYYLWVIVPIGLILLIFLIGFVVETASSYRKQKGKKKPRHKPAPARNVTFADTPRYHRLILLNNDLHHSVEDAPISRLGELAPFATKDYFRTKIAKARKDKECEKIADEYERQVDAIKQWLYGQKKHHDIRREIDAILAETDEELLDVPYLQDALKELEVITADHQITFKNYSDKITGTKKELHDILQLECDQCDNENCDYMHPTTAFCLCHQPFHKSEQLPVARPDREDVILADKSLDFQVKDALQGRYAHLLSHYNRGDLVGLADSIMEEISVPGRGKVHDSPALLLSVIEAILADHYQIPLTWKVPRVYQEHCSAEQTANHWLHGIKGQLVTYAATLGHQIGSKAGNVYLYSIQYFNDTGAWQRSLYEQRASDFNATVNTSAIVPLKKQIGQVITEIDDTKIKKNNIKRSKELNSSEMSVELKMIDHQQGQLEQTLATLKATLCEVEHLEKSQED